MRKENTLHQKAVRLCEGGSVWVNSLCVRAKRVPDYVNACEVCEMDSACNKEMCDVCAECDGYERKKHILYFAIRSHHESSQDDDGNRPSLLHILSVIKKEITAP